MTAIASPGTIRLVISDVDGTLLTQDKVLTAEVIAAAAALRDAGIPLAVTSSRPVRGMRMLVGPLALDTPLAGFNGGLIGVADEPQIAAYPLAPHIARRAATFLAEHGIETWLFDKRDWFVTDPDTAFVARERGTVQFDPVVVPRLDEVAGPVFKIVGASSDAARLAACEADLRTALGTDASVARSQAYYLDITHPAANKGHVVDVLSEYMSVPRDSIAVIGDGVNDVPMFRAAGLAIAMGNAVAEARAAAHAVTATNAQNGFAEAVWRFILGTEHSNTETNR